MGYGLKRSPIFLNRKYGVIQLIRSELYQKKLDAKSDECLFVGYPISVLQHFGTKVVFFKSYTLIRERVSSKRREWEQG